MTPEEVIDLLSLISARDNRTVGQATVAAWCDDIGDLAFDDAREAVRQHFREAADTWLMAAHIRRRVKKLRADRLHDFQYVPVPGDESTAVYLRALREQQQAVADGQREPAPALPAGATDRQAELKALCDRSFRRPPRVQRSEGEAS